MYRRIPTVSIGMPNELPRGNKVNKIIYRRIFDVVDAIIRVAIDEMENPNRSDLRTPKLSLIQEVIRPHAVMDAPHMP